MIQILQVEGMSCNHCVKTIEEALEKIEVKSSVDLAGKSVTVEFHEGKVTLAQIKGVIENQGFDVV
ncbi:cation transporter [Thermoactinomyces sp. DSM 45892]|uniref:cation transporter n=1 Tax=Thermoactinomyces sp. DSM 45892 TaxID=1882753 RepID=UPI00089CF220|nr:cation transporter [Thermoactinomyces sp. DSM 45892]SDZ14045.1 copper chaperone [Thermoactinomyces sp. DSM 45892]